VRAESRRKFDQDLKEGAVRLVRETGRPHGWTPEGCTRRRVVDIAVHDKHRC
jgi:hypothetical protein